MTEEWRSQYPSVVTTRSYKGSDVLAGKFRGEADKLLYQLKNLMTFRDIKQLSMTRLFPDGTKIIAWSIFGHNFVRIDTTLSTEISVDNACTITLIDLPEVVQPMRYPGEIHAGEVQGIDYIKVYYTIDVDRCNECVDEAWNLCDLNVPECDQFKFILADIPHVDGDEEDHCFYGSCHAQLITHGVDVGGRYLIFKVFTEWSFANPLAMTYSRNGLGYMLLKGRIEDIHGVTVCEVQDTLKVDCCIKDPELRKVILWDESDWFGGGREMIFDASGVFYKTPTVVTLAGLTAYALGSGTFWVLPDIYGNCLPLTWTLSGPGTLLSVIPGASASYQTPPDGFNCNDSVMIRVRDRCGTEDIVTTSPCCADASPLAIGYTSLVMGCGSAQQLSATGGCSPYSWSVESGGGTIEGTGAEVIYNSPETNENCANNPTIQVTDCCGNSAQIQLAVNCYSPLSNALQFCGMSKTSTCLCTECISSQCSSIRFNLDYLSTIWGCDGNVVGTPCNVPGYTLNGSPIEAHDCIPYPNCAIPPGGTHICTSIDACQAYIDNLVNCNLLPFCADCYGKSCNTLYDLRTAGQKTDGCCPLNPFTGLPY